jgi:hypothetical protein
LWGPLQERMVIWDRDRNIEFPNLPDGSRYIILITHDESTFYENDQQKNLMDSFKGDCHNRCATHVQSQSIINYTNTNACHSYSKAHIPATNTYTPVYNGDVAMLSYRFSVHQSYYTVYCILVPFPFSIPS